MGIDSEDHLSQAAVSRSRTFGRNLWRLCKRTNKLSKSTELNRASVSSVNIESVQIVFLSLLEYYLMGPRSQT
jgi:hypothetical protein